MAKADKIPFGEFNSFEEFFDQAKGRVGYWKEIAKLEFTRDVVEQMAHGNVSKGELAKRLEVNPGVVTKLLSGNNNFEIETMVRVAMALKCRFRSHLQPEGANTIWFDVLNIVNDAYLDEWKPYEFKSVERFFPSVYQVNYEARTVAA